MDDFLHQYAPLIVAGFFAVLWYLLRQKDEKQAAQIEDLYAKHAQDEKALAVLQIEIARQHYVKGELDAKFDKLEVAFREEMRALGDRIACSFNQRPQERRTDGLA
jgi:aminoglycoside phosphotransferase family enzyme